jgi:hypothetical protein
VASISELQPWLQPYAAELIQIGAAYGARVTSVYRSDREQRQLYAAYLRGQSRYPVAPPGQSFHQYRRAWDMVADPRVLAWLGDIWEAWGGTWGGRGRDPIHFEA